MTFLDKKIEVRVLVEMIDRRYQNLIKKRADALSRGQSLVAGNLGDSMIQLAMLKHDLIDLLTQTEAKEMGDEQTKSI